MTNITMTAPAHVADDPEPRPGDIGSHYGCCPVCGKSDEYLNIGREHWFFCEEHKIAWHVGANLFSSWRDQTAEDLQRNAAKLAGFTIIKESDGVTPEQRKAREEYRQRHDAWAQRRHQWMTQHATELQSYMSRELNPIPF